MYVICHSPAILAGVSLALPNRRSYQVCHLCQRETSRFPHFKFHKLLAKFAPSTVTCICPLPGFWLVPGRQTLQCGWVILGHTHINLSKFQASVFVIYCFLLTVVTQRLVSCTIHLKAGGVPRTEAVKIKNRLLRLRYSLVDVFDVLLTLSATSPNGAELEVSCRREHMPILVP